MYLDIKILFLVVVFCVILGTQWVPLTREQKSSFILKFFFYCFCDYCLPPSGIPTIPKLVRLEIDQNIGGTLSLYKKLYWKLFLTFLFFFRFNIFLSLCCTLGCFLVLILSSFICPPALFILLFKPPIIILYFNNQAFKNMWCLINYFYKCDLVSGLSGNFKPMEQKVGLKKTKIMQ